MRNHISARISGLDAYEIAVLEGFDGTRAEWLESLKVKGDKGDKGETGDTGNGIESVEKTLTDGIVDTYTIKFTDGTKQTYDVVNSIDTEPMDFTPFFVNERNYIVNVSSLNKSLPFIPIPSDSNPLVENNVDHAYRDREIRMRCVGIKVRAGQMFKISARHRYSSGTTLVFAEEYSAPIIRDIKQEPLDDFYYYIRKDGWLLINTTIAFEGAYVKKVTIFDEVELNQLLIKQAIDSIPTVEKVRDAVLEALPMAEDGEF